MIETSMTLASLWFAFTIFIIVAIASYIRILVIVHFIDKGLENPPPRPQIHDKLRAYRDWCKDKQRNPVLLILFGLSVIGAILCWMPLPWLIFK